MTSGVKRRCATRTNCESGFRLYLPVDLSPPPGATYVPRMAAVHDSFTLIRGGGGGAEHESLFFAGIIVFAIKTIEMKYIHPYVYIPRLHPSPAYPPSLRFRTATLLPSGDIIGTINVDAIIHRVAPFLSLRLSPKFPSFEDASLEILSSPLLRK